ncbi:MAG: dihydrofolate reductase [Anaerolineales bacterium]
MIVSIIAAVDERGGIGVQGGLPWHLSSDLKRFKKLTMGHHLIMGRKTYQSIGRPLPGRRMIVVTRNPDYSAQGCRIAHSLDEALEYSRLNGESEVFIIGGGEIFRQALQSADRIYLTRVHAVTEADTFFPDLDQDGWRVQTSSDVPAGPKDDYDHTFKLLVRAD